MKMLHKTRILSGMQIKQNLYRHDGLLATPKGYMINQREKQIIGYYDYEFILIEDKVIYKNEGSKLNEVLNIIEHVVTNSNLWTYSFGEELYDKFAEVVFKNKNRIKQLELMAELNAYHLTHYINTAIIVMSILTENDVKNLNTKTAEIFFLTLMHEIAKIETMRESSGQKYITREELMEMQKIPENTAKIVLKMGFNPYEIKFMYEIGERWDGQGYARLKGDEIEDLAQIIAIAKKYDELSAYKMDEGKESQKNIYKILSSEKNKAFNPKIVELFFERFEPYAIGDSVELNDGRKAEVIVLRSEAKFLPIVEYYDEQLNSKRVVDLSQEENLEIKKIEEYI